MESKKRIRTDSYRKSDKKYNEKSMAFSIGYRPTDIKEGQRLKAYLATTGQSANSYIKALIKQDLDSKDIAYPDDGISTNTME